MRGSVGISAIGYALPDQRLCLDDLDRQGLLESGAPRLRALGFEHVHVSEKAAVELAVAAVSDLWAQQPIDAESIDAVFYAGAVPMSHAVPTGGAFDVFSYPGTRVQYEFGLLNATVTGVSQAGCLGLTRAIQLGSDFLSAHSQAERVLAISADVLPAGTPREILYNAISDGACAVLIDRNAPRNRLIAARQVTKGYYWNVDACKAEIVAAYFPTARSIVRETLEAAGISRDQVDWVIPQNVSRRSWDILFELLQLGSARLYASNIAAKGHVIAADNLINLKDAMDEGVLRAGDTLLLFNFGFGANWSCTVLEH
jgi:3-oxoacyl-[acyl-carrier-protein] synthase-3